MIGGVLVWFVRGTEVERDIENGNRVGERFIDPHLIDFMRRPMKTHAG